MSVLDPFGGVGSTAKACELLGRICTSIELSEKYHNLSIERLESEVGKGASKHHNLINGDSCVILPQLASNSIDFIVTSPPYWGILHKQDQKVKKNRVQYNLDTQYSDDAHDLGNIEDYEHFLTILCEKIFLQCGRILRKGKYMAIIVSDFRDKGDFVSFHSDLIHKLNKAVLPEGGCLSLQGTKVLIQNHKSAWWNRLMRADGINDIMERCIKYEVNTRNGMITIQVSDQNPCIASLMVDSITIRIQKVMEKYMIHKAVTNYNNWKKLRYSTWKEYKDASRKYADFIDSNTNITQPSTKINSEQLQAEVYRTMAVYQEAASRCKVAEMQIQRTRPLFVKIVNNTVPLNPSNPKWIQNIAIWLFYSITGTTLFILYRRKYFSDSIKDSNG